MPEKRPDVYKVYEHGQVEEGEVTETNGYLPPRKERCSYCGRSLPVKEMVYLKHLWFCGVRHYRAFFGISHRRTK